MGNACRRDPLAEDVERVRSIHADDPRAAEVDVEFAADAIQVSILLMLDGSVQENQLQILKAARQEGLESTVMSRDLKIFFGGKLMRGPLQAYGVEAGASLRVTVDYEAVAERVRQEEARRAAEAAEKARQAEEAARRARFTNDEGARVCLGLDAHCSHLYYCGRKLGTNRIPGSDGRCGTHNGPQCASCRRFQAAQYQQQTADTNVIMNDEGVPVCLGLDARCSHLYYCGRRLGTTAIPGSDGRCGTHNGPQCAACKRLQRSRGC